MPKTDARIDAYISKSAEFAIPILEHLRALVHNARPEVEELKTQIILCHKFFIDRSMHRGMLRHPVHFLLTFPDNLQP